MGTSLIIKYNTNEMLDHSESQVAQEKPAVLNEFKNKISETVQKYFGEFAQVYEASFPSKHGKKSEHSQTFINGNITLSISEKVSSDEPRGLVLLFNKIFEKTVTDETITYKTIMRIRGPQQKLYLKESKPALEELAKIIEQQKEIDNDAKITYKLSDFS